MRRRDTSLSAALDEFVEFIDADRHKKNIRTMFTHAGPFLEDRGVERVEEIEVLDCREFAKYLSRLVDEDEIAASTANTYYSQFRSWLGFCVRDEMLDVNPAEKRRAEEMLPDEKGEDDQQFWSREEREAILEAADDQAESSMDQLTEPGWAPAFRNRAILYTLCYTGGRIGEIIGRGDDSERDGLTWSDVDLAGQSVRVFGKNREYEHMQLPSPAGAVLAEYREIVSPPIDDWPVFPSNSASKLYQVARAQLADRGLEEQEREALLKGREIYDVFHEEELVPPGMTAAGFRTSFWYDFVEEYDLYIDGEYPQFHGARRGLGDELYRENPLLAQSALRHSDIKTTHDFYSHIQAGETAADVENTIGADAPREFLQEDE